MANASVDFSGRDALAGVNELFVRRWSPRAYLNVPVPDTDLSVMLDAARWSPSAYNEQPWRFYTSTAESYDSFLELLVEGNQRWVQTAPVIGFVVARRHFDRNGEVNPHAVFDTGSAWMALNLQASMMGYHVHGMAGIHYEEVYRRLGLDTNEYQVICGFALGRLDPEGEDGVTGRKSLQDIWQQV